MKKLIFTVSYVLTFLWPVVLQAQTDTICFKNSTLCRSVSSCKRFPWIVTLDTIPSGALVFCRSIDQITITIPALVKESDITIPAEKTVLRGIITNLLVQNGAIIIDAAMKGYDEKSPFHIAIHPSGSDLENFSEFQERKIKKKKK